MRLFRTSSAIVVENAGSFYTIENGSWDTFINDDSLYQKMTTVISKLKPDPKAGSLIDNHLLPPVQSQELWASGVTYYRSKVGRQEESKDSGASDFYARVYEAERPELFFKATGHRIVGHLGNVRIRKDSTWNVPEPELTLVITTSGKIVGYTIGNDMSSRSIEGENPLYLPQAKTYDGSASLGPCVYVTDKPIPADTMIYLKILRDGKNVFEGNVAISQIVREFEELVSFLYRECSFPHGSLLMTGTGIVPGSDFTLQKNDVIHITINPIGTLINTVI
jgi:2-dehydro-3-deoxy-D-arabinonate dehydratase